MIFRVWNFLVSRILARSLLFLSINGSSNLDKRSIVGSAEIVLSVVGNWILWPVERNCNASSVVGPHAYSRSDIGSMQVKVSPGSHSLYAETRTVRVYTRLPVARNPPCLSLLPQRASRALWYHPVFLFLFSRSARYRVSICNHGEKSGPGSTKRCWSSPIKAVGFDAPMVYVCCFNPVTYMQFSRANQLKMHNFILSGIIFWLNNTSMIKNNAMP